jgi:hypothetical protein
MDTNIILNKFQSLPIKAQQELVDFLEFLSSKYNKQKKATNKSNFSFNWEGGLSDLKNQFTSVDLQHQVNNWR